MNALLDATGFPGALRLAVGLATARLPEAPGDVAGFAQHVPQRLRGAWQRALVERCCHRGASCVGQDGRLACPLSDCLLPRLYKPRCEAQKRDHPPPIALWADLLSAREISLRLAAFGATASDLAGAGGLDPVLSDAGQRGLSWNGGSVRFDATADWVFDGSLADYVAAAAVPEYLWIGFETPVQDEQNPGKWVANCAHDVVQWALADAGLSHALGKRACDAVADAARAAARDATRKLHWEWRRTAKVHGFSPLPTSGRRQPGFVGMGRISGDLASALPWLILLALRGAAGRRAFGMGAVRLARPDGEVLLPGC